MVQTNEVRLYMPILSSIKQLLQNEAASAINTILSYYDGLLQLRHHVTLPFQTGQKRHPVV